MIASFGSERARKIDIVAHSTDALRACKQADYERLESFMFSALADKWPQPEGHLRLRLIAAVGISALKVAVDRWRPDASGSLQDLCRRKLRGFALGNAVLTRLG